MANAMIDAPLYDHTGVEKGRRQLPAAVFQHQINEAAVHQSIRAYLTNRRQGDVSTRNRAMVSGGGKKPWRQKGTGRARAGSIRSPLWRGGGHAFRLAPKDYRLNVSKRMRRLALCSALSQKAKEEAIKVFEYFEFPAPKTRDMAQLLTKVGVGGKKVLILTEEVKKDVYLSGRNLPKVNIYPFKDISALEVLDADFLLIEDGVVETLEATDKVK
jgi:large subunit ribosomal protein L4